MQSSPAWTVRAACLDLEVLRDARDQSWLIDQFWSKATSMDNLFFFIPPSKDSDIVQKSGAANKNISQKKKGTKVNKSG